MAGTENLNRVVRESLAANAPPVFAAAQKRAQKVLTAALPRIGNLKIHVDGAPADKLTSLSITVDGVAVPPALLDADRPTRSRLRHEVSVAAPGYKTETTTVAVQEGGESAVQLKLEVDPSAVAAAPAPAVVVAPASPPGPTEAPPVEN